MKMKIYIVNGRKVWLDKAPEGYVQPVKKVEEKPAEKTEEKARPMPANKAKRATANKSRRNGGKK